jgi:DNA-binding transcriptional LysR family regulator
VGAAQVTGLSLPSLHRAVNDLSLSLRRQLVVRRGKAVVLTEAGKAMALSLRLGRLELETALAELAAFRGMSRGRWRWGQCPVAGAGAARRDHAVCAAPSSGAVAHCRGSRLELVEPLRNGVIDLMIGALRMP